MKSFSVWNNHSGHWKWEGNTPCTGGQSSHLVDLLMLLHCGGNWRKLMQIHARKKPVHSFLQSLVQSVMILFNVPWVRLGNRVTCFLLLIIFTLKINLAQGHGALSHRFWWPSLCKQSHAADLVQSNLPECIRCFTASSHKHLLSHCALTSDVIENLWVSA